MILWDLMVMGSEDRVWKDRMLTEDDAHLPRGKRAAG